MKHPLTVIASVALVLVAASAFADSPCRSGLCVVVDCSDTTFLGKLAARPSVLVQALYRDQSAAAAALEYIEEKKLFGKLSVALWDGVRLPYVGNNVNGMVLSGLDLVEEPELKRVLAPGGTACRLDGSVVFAKALADGVDEWTHHLYNAGGVNSSQDRMVGPPRHLKWKAGPEFSRSHENISSVSAVVSEGGRVYSIIDTGPIASIYLPSKWLLIARDAYSGVLLWQKEIKDWQARLFPLKNGGASLQMTRRLIAVDGHVYGTLGLDAPVSKINGATGEIEAVYAATEHAEELVFADGRLITICADESSVKPYQGALAKGSTLAIREWVPVERTARSLVIVDTTSDEPVVDVPYGEILSLSLVADGSIAAFYVENDLVAVDVSSGKERWRKPRMSQDRRATAALFKNPVLLMHDKVVYAADARTLTAYRSRDGEELWRVDTVMGAYMTQPTLIIHDKLIWNTHTGGEPYRPGYKLGASGANRTFIGFDLKTSEVKRELPIGPEGGYGVMHHRCHPPRAVSGHIITSFPGVEFLDSTSGDLTHASWVRGACLYGFMPANGLLYMPPHPCACYAQGKLSGFMGIAPADREHVTPADDRLYKGPAFGQVTVGMSRPGDWPTYRGNGNRAGIGQTRISARPALKWQLKLGPGLTQPVVSSGMLFTVSREENKLFALDEPSGKILWTKRLPARVDSPPTCYQGMLIFGSRDGYVYSLGMRDGALVWRFLAATADRRIVSYERVESLWPVHGSVLVHNDELWFAAGRNAFLDGGIALYRLDPHSGAQLWHTNILHLGDEGKQPETGKVIYPGKTTQEPVVSRLDMAGAKSDVLSTDGTRVFMRHLTFDSAGREIEQATAHIFAPFGLLDESWFRRSYWIYGHRYLGGAQGWAQIGNMRTTGRILAVGTHSICGYGRPSYPPSPANSAQMYRAGEYEVFFADKKQSSAERMKWQVVADIQTRGLVLCNDEEYLVAAGAKGNWILSPRAFEGREGALIRIMSTTDGSTLHEIPIASPPVHDGLIAANACLYIALKDGRVVSFE